MITANSHFELRDRADLGKGMHIMVSIVLGLLGLVGAAILGCLAWIGWASKQQRELPRWRSALSFSALLLLSANWIAVAVLETPVFIRLQVTRSDALTEALLTLSHPISVLVILLSLALRSTPRIQAMLAGLLLLISWPLGYA